LRKDEHTFNVVMIVTSPRLWPNGYSTWLDSRRTGIRWVRPSVYRRYAI